MECKYKENCVQALWSQTGEVKNKVKNKIWRASGERYTLYTEEKE